MVSQNSINNIVDDNDFVVKRTGAGVTVQSVAIHTDDTSGTSDAKLLAKSGGTSGGDPHVEFAVGDTQSYAIGPDNSDSDNLKITGGTSPSTGSTYLTCDQATTNVFFSGISFDAGTNIMKNYLDLTTWTPSLEFGGGSTGITYSATRNGHILRVGNLVFFRCEFVITSKGSDTGDATITGLPVLSNTSSFFYFEFGDITLNGSYTVASGAVDSFNIKLRQSGSGVGVTPLTDVNFSNTSQVALTSMMSVA